MRLGPLAAALTAVLLAPGCADRGARTLAKRRTALRHEVAGLRQLANQLERGEPIVAPDEVAVAIDAAVVRELIAAELPFETDVERFRVRLTSVALSFHGRPAVELGGTARLRDRPELEGVLNATGAIEDIAIDARTGMLRARLAVDEIALEPTAGLAAWLNERGLDELTLDIRSQLGAGLPSLEIPVQIQQRLELPALTSGPLLTHGAVMSLRATVTRVVAGRGTLWIGVRVEPGVIEARRP